MLFVLLLACSEPQKPAEPVKPATTAAAGPAGVTVDPAKKALFKPLPAQFDTPDNPLTPEKIALGQMLYHDRRLSKNQDLSCNSCHAVDKYGVDNNPTSTGHKGQLGGRNSPTTFNAAGEFVQFWDGRAADVEAQAKGPVLNPVEMAMKDDKAVVALLVSIPGYVDAFAKAYPGEKDPITWDNYGKAVGAFERTLVTPSPFDRWLAGDEAALTDAQKTGFDTFVDTGCATCHNGMDVGGAMYQKAGLVEPWPDQADQGRFGVTKNEADKMMFKVPTLRNIEKTGPYFHDGKTASLDDAITTMGRYELGKPLTPEQVGQIRTFLGSLTGTLDPAKAMVPTLPPSGPKTPKPDPS